MRVIACEAAAGVDALRQALAGAQPGDELVLGAGDFVLDATLHLPEGITLRGAGRQATRFLHGFDGPALQGQNCSGLVLRDFAIHSTATRVVKRLLPLSEPYRDEPEAKQGVEWGLLFLDGCQDSVLQDLEVQGNPAIGPINGVSLRFCGQARMSNLSVSGVRNGLMLISMTGASVEGCLVSGCTNHGIACFSARGAPILTAAMLLRNRCHDNGGSGIVLLSSTSEDICGNECWGNTFSGIALLRDPETPDRPSSAPIRYNRCHGNGQVGILLASSTSTDISANECWGNAHSGIGLGRDPDSLDHPSSAPIRNNRCHGNGQVGILLASSTSADISANECWGNAQSGIGLQPDLETPDHPSTAPICDNRCHRNEAAGILLFSSTSADIRGNECWGNTGSGIALQRGLETPDPPSSAPIRNNRCHGNGLAGIVLSSSTSADICGNECWGNTGSGIALQRGLKTPHHPTTAPIRDNQCHGNGGAGIVLFSSNSADIRGNECWENTGSGIVLKRGPEAHDHPSIAPIRDNRCHGNGEAGILLFSSNSADMRGNVCWGNTFSGIALQRGLETPDHPTLGALHANLLVRNVGHGITCSGSILSACEANVLVRNGLAGIQLNQENRPFTPDRVAPITNNLLLGNGWPLTVVSGTAFSTLGNWSWDEHAPAMFLTDTGTPTSPIDWDAQVPPGGPQARRAFLRARLPWGALATRLEAEGIADVDEGRAEDLALFLHRGGIGMLKHWLGMAETDKVVRENEDAADKAPPPPDTVAFTLDPANTPATADPVTGEVVERFRFRPRPEANVESLLCGFLRQHRKKPAVHMLALAGRLEGPLAGVERDLDALRPMLADMRDVGTRPLGLSLTEMQDLRLGGHRLCRPLAADFTDRSLAAVAGRTPETPFLEPAPLTGARAWSARAAHLAQSLRAWALVLGALVLLFGLAVGVGWIKGHPDPLSDPLGAAWRAVNENLVNLQLVNYFFLPLTVLALVGGALNGLNRLLPQHLRLHLRRHLPQWLRGWMRPERSLPPRGQNWRDWLRRRIFADGDIAVVVLRNVVEWPEDDIAALQDLFALRPPGSSLILILTTPTRHALDQALVRPLRCHDGGRTLPGAVHAFLGTEGDGNDAPRPVSPEGLQTLLGLDVSESDLSALKGKHLRPQDLLAMLVLGSTLYHPAQVNGHIADRGEDLGPLLQELRPVFEANDPVADARPALVEDLRRLPKLAERASSLLVITHKNRRDDYYDILGRLQKRTETLAALQALLADRADFADYRDALLACGEALALRQVSAALRQSTPGVTRAIACAKSALWLRRERQGEGPQAARRSEALKVHWQAALAALDALPADSGAASADLALLHALSLHARPDGGGGVAQQAFDTEMAAARAGFDRMERDTALHAARVRLQRSFAALPEAEATRVNDMLKDWHARGHPLMALLRDCDSAARLQRLAAEHQAIQRNFWHTQLSLLAELAGDDDERLALARYLGQHREALKGLLPGSRAVGPAPGPSGTFADRLEWVGSLPVPSSTESSFATLRTLDTVVYGNVASCFGSASAKAMLEFG